MTRPSKFLLLFVLLVFVLACNVVTQPIKDVQNVAGTAESLATAMPDVASTVQAVATNMPVSTLEALPSALPEIETAMPNIENMFNPQGTPVSEWKGIPIMSQATAGQEFNDSTYSFKANVTAKDVQDFYGAKLVDLGWSSMFSLPIESQGGIMSFTKGDSVLTITITSANDETVVVLALV